MARIDPRDRQDVPELEPIFLKLENSMGFVPNGTLTLAHHPELAKRVASLIALVMAPGRVDETTKRLVALAASHAAGSAYCQAHTAHTAARLGASTEAIQGTVDGTASDHSSDAQAAAFRLARDAARVPACVRGEHFEDLRKHFDREQILEIMAVISMFGWLNRWNQMLATELEDEPLRFAREHLGSRGWQPGPHVSEVDRETE